MAALTADRQTRTKANGADRGRIGDVAATKVIYCGALVAKNAAGYIVPASDTAALKVVGVSTAFVDNTAGADGALTVPFITGVEVELDNSAGNGGGLVVQAGKESRCYVADDHSVTSKAGSNQRVVAGIVTAFTAAKVWVQVDEMMGIDGNDVIVTGAVAPAVISSGPVEAIYLDIPNAATTTYAYLNADKIEIVDVEVIKDTAGAGNTIQVKTTADVVISDAIAAAVDKAVTRAGSLDKATRTLNAGAGFHITATNAAGSTACQVVLHVIKR